MVIIISPPRDIPHHNYSNYILCVAYTSKVCRVLIYNTEMRILRLPVDVVTCVSNCCLYLFRATF